MIQRVSEASVSVERETIAEIGRGLLVLAAVGAYDENADLDYVVEKVVNMRIFEHEGRFDLSVMDIDGEVLVVSNFTIYGDIRKGRRPSFTEAMAPSDAEGVYDAFVEKMSTRIRTQSGRFQAMMHVKLVNDGPVTLLIDSRARS